MTKLNKILSAALALAAVAVAVAPAAMNADTVATPVVSEVAVYATQGSSYTVKIPKTLILKGSDGTGAYTVSVTGNIDGEDTITVAPAASFLMKQAGKVDINTAVTQSDQLFTFNTGVTRTTAEAAVGTIAMEDISAGKWAGAFNFTITSTVDTSLVDSVASVATDILGVAVVGKDASQAKISEYVVK